MAEKDSSAVPRSLKTWFIIHFLIDMLFAIPLMLFPEQMLSFGGWQTIDPFTSRLAAAALFGIGIESYLTRNASPETYRGMLNLKIIWSSAAIVGIGLSLAQGAQNRPWFGWAVLLIFISFNGIWVYWRKRLA
jgi:hypothetical protein